MLAIEEVFFYIPIDISLHLLQDILYYLLLRYT